MNIFLDFMRNMSPVRLAAMAFMGVIFIGLAIFFISRFSGEPMELLYGGLSPSDSRSVVQALQSQGVSYEARSNGKEIFVPKSIVFAQRVLLAEYAVSGGMNVGYEVFDATQGVDSSSFVQSVNLLRALEGELARTIAGLDSIREARVHLVLPKREAFSREKNKPSASIYVRIASSLEQAQVVAIQNLVAAAVPELIADRVAIVDEKGRLLSGAFEGEEQRLLSHSNSLRQARERKFSEDIESMLERVVGAGRVRVEVNIDMDFDERTIREEVYDSEAPVVRSSVTRRETGEMKDNIPPNVSVQQNLPDAQLTNQGEGGSSRNEIVEETNNFEISRKISNHLKKGGEIKKITVSALLDYRYTEGATPEEFTTVPLKPEEIEEIRSLIAGAIGFDESRGDFINVVNLPFERDVERIFEKSFEFLGFTREEIISLSQAAGVVFIALLIVLFVVRPLLIRAFESSEEFYEQVAGDPATKNDPSGSDKDDDDELIDLDKIEGRVKASTYRKVSDVVDSNPEAVLNIIRSWMLQDDPSR